MKVREMMALLRAEKINTWFDLGLFIDRFKENLPVPSTNFSGSYEDFVKYLSEGGIAFITFFYSIDGVTMEIEKYAKVINLLFKNSTIHFIGGGFSEKSGLLIPPECRRYQLDELASFDNWMLYKDFFFEKLERGSKTYNKLIVKFRDEVFTIAEKLGKYIKDNDIRLLFLINVNSNPGNVALALATVFISEYMGIPVINNNHDFYWEEGHSEVEIQQGAKPGPRDHFFKNYHLGEVFSIIETIFPWDSRSWISVNINENQSKKLINEYGHNPANIVEIGTAIDCEKFHRINDENRKKDVRRQLTAIFSRYNDTIQISSVRSVLDQESNSTNDFSPMLIGARDQNHLDFVNDNIILLQPTRIIRRKTIEVNFKLLLKLFNDDEFIEYFTENNNLKITMITAGPIATGHMNYFFQILHEFNKLLSLVNSEYRNRIFLGFLFSEFDRPSFKQRFANPMGIEDLYNTASMILLPSETEGRGLPILEAAACCIPIFCRRYAPEEVYAKVIGEHLLQEDHIKNIEFSDPELNRDVIELVKQQIFSPKSFEEYLLHNREVVEKRFGLTAFKKEVERIFYKLYLQITSDQSSINHARLALHEYRDHLAANRRYAGSILNTENRQYLAGYGQMAFMIFLKSLIDPSYFRLEEKRFRGMAMQFAKGLVDHYPDPTPLPEEVVHRFYNSVDSIFLYREGELAIQLDHSFAYRHRNKIYYPYRDLTFQELTGVINLLFKRITAPPPVLKIQQAKPISDDWYENLYSLYNKNEFAIDHVDELEKKLSSNVPIALFVGSQLEMELALFVLYPVRKRLGMTCEKVSSRLLEKTKLAPIYIIQHNESLGNSITADVIRSHIYYSSNYEIKLLFKNNICKIISSNQHSVGVHFYEVGKEVIDVLTKVRDDRGFIIAFGDNAAMMTDIVDIDRFHIGRVSSLLTAKIMNIPMDSAYIQWVPAGLRFTLSYPTPVQTGLDFSKTLKSFSFKKSCETFGEEKVLQILKKEAEEKGTPIQTVLKKMIRTIPEKTNVTYSAINGIYADGLPWAGVLARIDLRQAEKKWQFVVLSTNDRPKTVLKFMEDFKATGKNARVAWNGGYILNAELVGKLGIPETFIGSPLGLIITAETVLSTPLFNKPAFIVTQDGKLHIKRVNCGLGVTISDGIATIVYPPDAYNPQHPTTAPCFYDLRYQDEYLEGNGRILVRLAGTTIKEIIRTKENEKVVLLPVGLTLSFPANQFPESWHLNQELSITMNGWEKIISAVEAGPQLLNDGEVCIDMELEGWKTQNSIKTQAARLDYLDMRGPKIAIGIDEPGNLTILVVNGRIRESVGATHHDMAEILKSRGIVDAMGFDPGGSSTLVVDNTTLNISPYNHEYEKDVYSMQPEPRAVSNAVIAYEMG